MLILHPWHLSLIDDIYQKMADYVTEVYFICCCLYKLADVMRCELKPIPVGMQVSKRKRKRKKFTLIMLSQLPDAKAAPPMHPPQPTNPPTNRHANRPTKQP